MQGFKTFCDTHAYDVDDVKQKYNDQIKTIICKIVAIERQFGMSSLIVQ